MNSNEIHTYIYSSLSFAVFLVDVRKWNRRICFFFFFDWQCIVHRMTVQQLYICLFRTNCLRTLLYSFEMIFFLLFAFSCVCVMIFYLFQKLYLFWHYEDREAHVTFTEKIKFMFFSIFYILFEFRNLWNSNYSFWINKSI